ncbi:MAG: hypothetical protein QOG09_93 [Solirubrobacterales bacterium]|jgi:hypothetical protein|nr:hypothetical protein [Solirubrobacterales bacterium]MDX6661991.1 hypothetical protein [Solirubrobacterales bacterium]
MFGSRITAIAPAGVLAIALAAAASPASTSAASAGCDSLAAARKAVPRHAPVRLAGRTCAPSSTVTVQRKRSGSSWRIVTRAVSSTSGNFAACGKTAGPAGTINKFRSVSPSGSSPVTQVRVKSSGSTSCSSGGSTGGATTPPAGGSTGSTGSTGSCALATPGSAIDLTLSGCRTVASDTAAGQDAVGFWGSVECVDPTRYQWTTSGGDSHVDASGAGQGNNAFRRMTVQDGDNFYGERCELGRNDNRTSPVAFYREGQRRATFLSLRLPQNFPLDANSWQVVMQMKQAQPANNGGGTPVIELDAYDGAWHLLQSDSAGASSDSHEIWSAPATKLSWTRFAFDVNYSQDPSKGSITVYADLNGDGDTADSGERSATIHTYTLKRETVSGSSSGLQAGDSIPSHLRTGIYHNPAIPCPGGCSVDVDNVQVLSS